MRIIAHLDLDAFFAAVEERDRPWLAGRPIVIGADPQGGSGRGVVSTANYKAREFGIRSALPISTAWKYAEAAKQRGGEETVFLRGSHGKYSTVSGQVMKVVRQYAPVVEQASVDEAYLDLSHTGSWKEAQKTAAQIKRDIFKTEKLTCSVGIGPNKLVAKIASDIQKPDGLTVVTQKRAGAFLSPMSVRVIPGVGPKSATVLEKEGMRTVAEARDFSEPELEQLFGVWGRTLYRTLRGVDETPLVEERGVQSIGKHHTFEQDTLDARRLGNVLEYMAQEIITRMRQKDFTGFRTITLTVRFADFATKDRSYTCKSTAQSQKHLLFEANRLLAPFLDKRENPAQKEIRLIGLRIAKLSG